MITDNFHRPNSKVYFAHISITLKTLSDEVMELINKNPTQKVWKALQALSTPSFPRPITYFKFCKCSLTLCTSPSLVSLTTKSSQR